MHSFIHCVLLLEGWSALKPFRLQQRWPGNQCVTLLEDCLAFKSLSAQRNREFKSLVEKQQERPRDPGVFWELSLDIHAD